jgi:hypothetical protein
MVEDDVKPIKIGPPMTSYTSDAYEVTLDFRDGKGQARANEFSSKRE